MKTNKAIKLKKMKVELQISRTLNPNWDKTEKLDSERKPAAERRQSNNRPVDSAGPVTSKDFLLKPFRFSAAALAVAPLRPYKPHLLGLVHY